MSKRRKGPTTNEEMEAADNADALQRAAARQARRDQRITRGELVDELYVVALKMEPKIAAAFMMLAGNLE